MWARKEERRSLDGEGNDVRPSDRITRLAGVALLATLCLASTARADQGFWKNLGKKYGDSRPVVGLLNECLDYVSYTGELEFKDVTQQSGLEATKSATTFKGSRFALESRYHWVTAVFDAEKAADMATFRIPFHSKRSIADLEARVIRQDGTPVAVPGDRIVDEPIAPGLPAYADLRWRVVNFGPLADSCILDVKYTVRTAEEFCVNRFVFDHPYPTDHERYAINVPKSVLAGFSWWTDSFHTYNDLGRPDNEVVAGSTGELQRYTWELSGVGEVPVEPLSVPLIARARSVDLTVAFERDWDQMLAWYRAEVDTVFAEDARGAEMAREIVRGIEGDSLKARAIFDHVRGHVRWVPIPFYRTTLTPDPPSEVLERGYADAKDMAACLAFLLRSAGLEAHMALVSTGPTSRFDQRFPSWVGFDHAVVFLLLPTRQIWLDATDPILGFGMVSEAVAGGHWETGATPFLVWEGLPNFWTPETAPITTPAYGGGDCGYELMEPEVIWDPSGTLGFRATLQLRGALSLTFRRSLMGKAPEEQRAAFADWLNRSGGKENVAEFEALNLENLDEDLRVRFALSRPWTPGEDEIRVPSRFFGLPYPQEVPAEPKRATSVAFSYPLLLDNTVSVSAPEGYAIAVLPRDITVESPFLRSERKYFDMSGNVRISSTLVIQEEGIARDRYGHFLAMLEAIRKSGDEEIVFRKTPLVGQAGE